MQKNRLFLSFELVGGKYDRPLIQVNGLLHFLYGFGNKTCEFVIYLLYIAQTNTTILIFFDLNIVHAIFFSPSSYKERKTVTKRSRDILDRKREVVIWGLIFPPGP